MTLLCVVALLSAVLGFAQSYGTAAGSCDVRWTMIYEHDSQGNEVSGNIQDLITAVLKGAEVRIHVPSWSDGGYSAATHHVRTIKGNVCAQSLLHISKTGWNDMDDDAHWRFVNLCTTGHVHMSRWHVGDHSKPSRGDTRTTVGAMWFIKHLGPTGVEFPPLLSITEDGTVIDGSLASLVSAVGKGADIRPVNRRTGRAHSLEHMDFDQSLVTGQSVWQLGETDFDDHVEFESDTNWWFTIAATDGHCDISKWKVGMHSSSGCKHEPLPFEWFSDPCWTLAYEHDDSGDVIDGSLDFLRSAALKGHRVKVIRGNYSIEADVLKIRGDHVNALLLGHVSKASPKYFERDDFWYWQIASTTGRTRTYRYDVGSTKDRGTSETTDSMSWYIDSRPWRRAMTHDETGSVSLGSESDLAESVRHGAKVRYALKFSQHAGDVTILPADNLAIGPNDHVAAQNTRHVSMKDVGDSEVEMELNPHWWFSVTSTEADINISKWTVGKHEKRGSSKTNVAVEWFVSD